MENHPNNTTSTRIKSKIKVCFKSISKPTTPPDVKPEPHDIRNVLLAGAVLIAHHDLPSWNLSTRWSLAK
ncbi:hypothetical protein D5086_025671 [Populus alba]|uniref:Uncharacterized protein n=1 Tax=Populus alba TaxID=43335 RepID=A0ACC4AZR5_POPAL